MATAVEKSQVTTCGSTTPVRLHPVIVALVVPSYGRLATVKSTVTGSAARTPAGGMRAHEQQGHPGDRRKPARDDPHRDSLV